MPDPIEQLNSLRRCTRCALPETHESITFDAEGVCNVCRQVEFKQERIDWDARAVELDELIEQYRGTYAYDCIVPFSGGKDSTFTLWYLVRQKGLKPLVVSFDHGFYRPNHLENVERTITTLGVDYMRFRPNWDVVRKLMLEALERKGDFCWHCHTGIFSFPMQIAVKFEVPLLFWGEPSAEYTSYYSYDQGIEEVDERRFNRFVNLGITAEDMEGMLDDSVTMRDLEPFAYPKMKDLRRVGVRSVCLGSFIPWDVKQQVAIIKEELGWREDVVEGVPEGYGYEKIECAMQGVRDYIKYLKRGYGRTAHLASIDIRNGRMDRETAAQLIAGHDGKRPASLDVFLEYVGIDEGRFMEIVAKHVVAPWQQPDLIQIESAAELWDHQMWPRRPDGVAPGATTGPSPLVQIENAVPMASEHGTFSQATAEAMGAVPSPGNGTGPRNGDAANGHEPHRNGTSVPRVAAPGPPDDAS
jgi:N-acetyl sugar amidotransferase